MAQLISSKFGRNIDRLCERPLNLIAGPLSAGATLKIEPPWRCDFFPNKERSDSHIFSEKKPGRFEKTLAAKRWSLRVTWSIQFVGFPDFVTPIRKLPL